MFPRFGHWSYVPLLLPSLLWKCRQEVWILHRSFLDGVISTTPYQTVSTQSLEMLPSPGGCGCDCGCSYGCCRLVRTKTFPRYDRVSQFTGIRISTSCSEWISSSHLDCRSVRVSIERYRLARVLSNIEPLSFHLDHPSRAVIVDQS